LCTGSRKRRTDGGGGCGRSRSRLQRSGRDGSSRHRLGAAPVGLRRRGPDHLRRRGRGTRSTRSRTTPYESDPLPGKRLGACSYNRLVLKEGIDGSGRRRRSTHRPWTGGHGRTDGLLDRGRIRERVESDDLLHVRRRAAGPHGGVTGGGRSDRASLGVGSGLRHGSGTIHGSELRQKPLSQGIIPRLKGLRECLSELRRVHVLPFL
jgi:hypothetical protein